MHPKINRENIAGTVVLYNSPSAVIDNIKTYIDQVQKLYVVDNSVMPNDELRALLSSYSHVHYHSLNGNKGIATALNWAAEQAIIDGFIVLLTMDDDTRTPDTMVAQMMDFWNSYPTPIGILSGVHHTDPEALSTKPKKALHRTLLYTLTSGNILNLLAYKEVGRFWDDLFIDHVDHEYGLRLNSKGYQVVELQYIQLEHRLGYRQEIRVGGRVIKKYGTHPPIRLYYFARNGVYVARSYFKQHPLFTWMVIKELVKRSVKAVFLDANRKSRIQMLLRGIQDGWKGRLGDYSNRVQAGN